jgi:hypothetical protein
MNAYVFQAALLCEDCGEQVKQSKPFTGAPIDGRDSECWPQGPYSDGGGEADTPQHCDSCGVFLENPLTTDGLAYVADEARGRMNSLAHTLWAPFYGIDLDEETF